MKRFNEICEIITVIIIAGVIIIGSIWANYTYHKSIIRDAIEESKTSNPTN